MYRSYIFNKSLWKSNTMLFFSSSKVESTLYILHFKNKLLKLMSIYTSNEITHQFGEFVDRRIFVLFVIIIELELKLKR